MSIKLYHSVPKAQILIVTPTAGSYQAVIPLTVAALIVWFLGCIPAQALGVMIFSQAVAIRGWLRGWRAYVAGWREDLAMMGLALQMTARLEFA